MAMSTAMPNHSTQLSISAEQLGFAGEDGGGGAPSSGGGGEEKDAIFLARARRRARFTAVSLSLSLSLSLSSPHALRNYSEYMHQYGDRRIPVAVLRAVRARWR
jgi:hypothetical protein